MQFNADNAPIHFEEGKTNLCEVSLETVPEGCWFYCNLWGGPYEHNYYRFEAIRHHTGKQSCVDAAWVGQSGQHFPAKNPYRKIFSQIPIQRTVYLKQSDAKKAHDTTNDTTTNQKQKTDKTNEINVLNFWNEILLLRWKHSVELVKAPFQDTLYAQRSEQYARMVEDGLQLNFIVRDKQTLQLNLANLCQEMRNGDPAIWNAFLHQHGQWGSPKKNTTSKTRRV